MDDRNGRMEKQDQGEGGKKADNEGELGEGEGIAVFAQDELGHDDYDDADDQGSENKKITSQGADVTELAVEKRFDDDQKSA